MYPISYARAICALRTIFYAGAITVCIHSSLVMAQPSQVQDTASWHAQSVSQSGPARWRTGEAIVTESATDPDGWLTLDCEGADAACRSILGAIQSSLPTEKHRRAGGRMQVRAANWYEMEVMRLGPIRAATGEAVPTSPWLDARYDVFQCRWRNDAGEHLIELAGGPTAKYIGPDNSVHNLTVKDLHACSRCAAMNFIKIDWHDASRPETGILKLSWNIYGIPEVGKDEMTGGARWSDQRRSASMVCVAR